MPDSETRDALIDALGDISAEVDALLDKIAQATVDRHTRRGIDERAASVAALLDRTYQYACGVRA